MTARITGPIHFELAACDPACAARAGLLRTARGRAIATPTFMPVGTHGAVKTMTPEQLARAGVGIVLANTYHLAIRPGEGLVAKAGGLHRFMGWDGTILTDSGGFQVFSLPDVEITDEGVRFRYEKQGERIFLGPHRSIQIQEALGADIIMAFDECTPYPCPRERAEQAVDRTLVWARLCLEAHARKDQALFGIAQGSVYEDLRVRCTRAIAGMPFDGFAIGGVSVGEGLERLIQVLEWSEPHLPRDRARYLMGVGLPEDIVESIERGMDLFDCVIPTRFARSATVFTWRGKIRLTNRRYRRDLFPIDPNCRCETCARSTRAYLHHLFQSGELLGPVLAAVHNVTFYETLVARAREAILERRYRAWKDAFLGEYRRGA